MAQRDLARGTFAIFDLHLGRARLSLRLHWTLLLALLFCASGVLPGLLAVGAGRAGGPGHAGALGWLVGGLLAVALFLSVMLHEVAHAWVAIRLGATVRGIKLMFLGGETELSHPLRAPSEEVAVAAVGPAVSLAIGVLASLGAHALPSSGTPAELVALFGHLNVAIGLFNLLPAYPLDGGRMLRGTLARFIEPPRATLVASFVGRILAVLIGIFGVLTGTLLLSLIAVFLFFASSAEARAEIWDARLRGVPVSQLMDPFVTTVRDDAPVEEAARHFERARRVRVLVEREGRVVGMVSASRVHAVPFTFRLRMSVAALMDAPPAPVASHDAVTLALRRMDDLELDELPVVDAGHLSGILRLSEVHRWIAHVVAEERQAAAATDEVPTS